MGNSSSSKRRKCSPGSPQHNKDSTQTIKRNNWVEDRSPHHSFSGSREVNRGLQQHICNENDLEKSYHNEKVGNISMLYKDDIRKKNESQETKNLQTENKMLMLENDNLKREGRELISKLEGDKEELKMEIDDLKTRLSKLASDRLTDNNPNITDLSDDNRAIKVGEKFIELYNNEWSDAFEELTEVSKMEEVEAIKYLFDTIKEIFDKCKKTAQEHSNKLEEAILEFTGNEEIHPMLAMSLKVYKDERKRKFRNTVPSTKTIIKAIAPPKERILGKLNTYVEAATRICWLMCIQDPPMVLYTIKKGKKFDGKYFSAYTERGNRVAFPVWPALLLCNDGPVVQKGIAQGKNKKKRHLASISPSSTNNNEKTQTLKSDNNTMITVDDGIQELDINTSTRVEQELDKSTLTRIVPYAFPGETTVQ